MNSAAKSYSWKTGSCWIQITITVLIYIIFSFFANFLKNPFIPGAIIAIYMPIVIIGGHLQGKIPGLIIGLIATTLTTFLKVLLNDPNFMFELAAIIPHGIMGFIAGMMGNKKNSILSSLSIIPGHLLNIIFYAMFGLIQFREIIEIYLHIGLIAEIMLNLSIIILGIRLLEKHFYNKNRLRTKVKPLHILKKKKINLSHQFILNGLKIGFIVSILLIITISVYINGYRRENTKFYLIVYLIPIIFSGYWFGLNGSLTFSALISIIIVHEIFFPTISEINKIYDQIAFFIIFFNLVAIIIGELKRRWESSKEEIKEMKFQEDMYNKMHKHFLSNYLQNSLLNLELLKNEYSKRETFNLDLVNDAIKNIKLSSITSKKIDNIVNIIEQGESFEEEWQKILSIINEVIENWRQKKEDKDFHLKSPEDLNWFLLSDENLRQIFHELFFFLLNSEKVNKIMIDGETKKNYRTIKIESDNLPQISKEACSKLTNKITENWIYHGYYLPISHAAIIIQHYNGNLDIITDEESLKFIIKFPIEKTMIKSP